MNKMMEDQVIDVESIQIPDGGIPVDMQSEAPVKTKEERAFEMERFNQLKKMVKQKRKYYKSNLFQIRKIDNNK
jgi:hypothetical protein